MRIRNLVYSCPACGNRIEFNLAGGVAHSCVFRPMKRGEKYWCEYCIRKRENVILSRDFNIGDRVERIRYGKTVSKVVSVVPGLIKLDDGSIADPYRYRVIH